MEPSITLGFACGSGDESLRDGKDGSIRQTGLQDNNGITSFKYCGEVFEPELSNILIFTAGLGIKPTKNSSLGVVYHRYLQHEAEDDIRDSNLKLDPNGNSRELGDELDLIIGYRPTREIRIETVVGAFFQALCSALALTIHISLLPSSALNSEARCREGDCGSAVSLLQVVWK